MERSHLNANKIAKDHQKRGFCHKEQKERQKQAALFLPFLLLKDLQDKCCKQRKYTEDQ